MNEDSLQKKLDIHFDYTHTSQIILEEESEKILNLISLKDQQTLQVTEFDTVGATLKSIIEDVIGIHTLLKSFKSYIQSEQNHQQYFQNAVNDNFQSLKTTLGNLIIKKSETNIPDQIEKLSNQINDQQQMIEKLTNELQTYKSVQDQLTQLQSQNYKRNKEQIQNKNLENDLAKQQIIQLQENIKQMENINLEKVSQLDKNFTQLNDQFQQYKNKITDYNKEQNENQIIQNQTIDEFKNQFKKVFGEQTQIQEFIQEMFQFKDQFSIQMKDQIENLIIDQSDQTKRIEEQSKEFDQLKTQLQHVSESLNSKLSKEEFEKIQENSKEVLIDIKYMQNKEIFPIGLFL